MLIQPKFPCFHYHHYKKRWKKTLSRTCKWGRTCLFLLWIFVQWRFYTCKTLLCIFNGPHNQEVKCLFGLCTRHAVLIGMNGRHLCVWYLILLVSTLDASCLTACCRKFFANHKYQTYLILSEWLQRVSEQFRKLRTGSVNPSHVPYNLWRTTCFGNT